MTAADVAAPTAGLPRLGETVDHRAEPGDETLWSVTTLIGEATSKERLGPWMVRETATRLLEVGFPAAQQRLERDGYDETLRWLTRLRFQRRLLSDADHGKLVHHLFNLYALDGTRPQVRPEMHPDWPADHDRLLDPEDLRTAGLMLDQYDRFLQEYQPSYDAAEVVVYHPYTLPNGTDGYGYAGQADAFLHLEGQALVADYKTSRKTYTADGKLRGPWPSVSPQLAAYRYAAFAAIWRARKYENYRRRYYLLSEAEKAAALPVPAVEGGVAIYVTPERYAVHPVRCGPAEFRTYRHMQEVARWAFNDADSAVGNPMMPPHPLPVDQGDPFEGLPQW